MSAANRSAAAGTGHVRHADDAYFTPSWCTRAILARFSSLSPNVVLEPSCGNGAIVREVRAQWPNAYIEGVEIDDARALEALGAGANEVATADFLAFTPPGPRPDLVIGNPPFSLAMEFVQHSLHVVRPGGAVVMLLRLAWLASQKRALWMRANTPSVHVLPRRPSFTGSGTDSADYAWFSWWGDRCGLPKIEILDVELRERGAR